MRDENPQAVTLRQLAGTPDDATIVQGIYDAAPTYARTTTGEPSRPGAAQRTFEMLPEGCALTTKHMFLILRGNEPVGFADVIREFPDTDSAYIGLFLIAEACHGRGVGRSAYRQLESLIECWPGMRRIELSVLAVNEPAFGFWAAMGFAPTGKRSPYKERLVRSEHVFFAKTLRRTP
jgi:RimJ/RimL family protein N-acetyltransferase